MSRVGKKPIPIPDTTTVSYADRMVTVKSDKGTLTRAIPPLVDLQVEDGTINVTIEKTDRTSRALQGLVRSLVANMVIGVDTGFVRVLEINGIGYRAAVNGSRIELSLGYSHPVLFELPEGISAEVQDNTVIRLAGIDKELLGRTAVSIRQLRPPEPYKGKGIKFAEERIQRKAGKTSATA